MPYIDEQSRKFYSEEIEALADKLEEKGWKKGEFNYVVTMLVVRWLCSKNKSYDFVSDIKGVLTDIRDEFKRRIMDVYEDSKIIQNGDVYGTSEEK